MANATLQVLLAMGSAVPGVPSYVFDPAQNASILNDSGVACVYGEKIRTIKDLSGAARDAVQTTIANQATYLAWGGENYLYCRSGNSNARFVQSVTPTNGNAATAMTVQTKVAADDWTPAAARIIASRNNGTTAAGSAWDLVLLTTGVLRFSWYSGGSAFTADSTANLSALANFTARHIRVQYVQNTGAGQRSIIFETSTDGSVWTQLGTTITGASTGNINSVVLPLYIGCVQSAFGNPTWAGAIYYCTLRDGGPTGTILNDFQASAFSYLTNSSGILTIGSTAALISKGTIFVPGGNSIEYTIPSIALTSIGGGALMRTYDGTIGSESALCFGTTGSVNPHLAFKLQGGGAGMYASSDDSQQSFGTGSSDFRINATANEAAGTWNFLTNSSASGALVGGALGSTGGLDRLFRRGTNFDFSTYHGKMILYNYAESNSLVATYLET